MALTGVPRLPSGYGHDKSQAILPYRSLPHKPILFFFGDGVSDLSAAQHADVLFAKDKPDGENDFAAYWCALLSHCGRNVRTDVQIARRWE